MFNPLGDVTVDFLSEKVHATVIKILRVRYSLHRDLVFVDCVDDTDREYRVSFDFDPKFGVTKFGFLGFFKV